METIIVSSLSVCPRDLRPVNLLVNSYQFFTTDLSTSIGHKCVHTHTHMCAHTHIPVVSGMCVCVHAHAHTRAHIHVSPLFISSGRLGFCCPTVLCSCGAENGNNSRMSGSLDFSVICVSLLEMWAAIHPHRTFLLQDSQAEKTEPSTSPSRPSPMSSH